jgi:hypothetical protein
MSVYPYQGLEGGHDAHRDGDYDLVEISDLLEYTKQPEGPQDTHLPRGMLV